MTNQGAIEILKTERNHMIPTLFPERIEAMDMAISALQAQGLQPTCNELANDTISRQAAIDTAIEAADDWDGGYNLTRGNMIEEAIKKLPSAQPEITDEQAIRERLADDSGSYDSLIPCEDTTDRQVAGKLKNPAESLLSGQEDVTKEQPCKLEPCEDCISREAAIKTLQKDLLWTGYTVEAVKEDSIDLIKKLPPVTQKLPECEDAVSREDVINFLCDWICAPGERCVSACKCLKGIRELPSVISVKGYCRDCYHFSYDHASDCTVCFKDDYAPMEPDDYCSKWEKKDG